MRKKLHDFIKINALTILWSFSFAVFILLFIKQPGFVTDFGTFWSWSQKLALQPLNEFYSAGYFADYFPGYLYILKILGHISIALNLDSQAPASIALFKAPSLLALTLIALIFIKYSAKENPTIEKLFLSLAVILAPSLLYNVLTFGQVDTVICLIIIVLLKFLHEKKLYQSAIFLALAVSSKPQTIFLAPFILLWIIHAINQKTFALATWLESLGIFCLAVISFFAPFWWNDPSGAINHVISGLQSYAYFSVNAFNLPYLIGGNWGKMDENYFLQGVVYAGTIWAIATLFFFTYRFSKSKKFALTHDQMLTFGALSVLVIFLFAPKMHERYSLIAYAFFFFIALRSPQHFLSYMCFTVASILNQAMVIDHFYGAKQEIDGPIVYGCLALNILSVMWLFQAFKISFETARIKNVESNLESEFKRDQKKWVLIGIGFLAAFTTFFHLGSTEIPKTGALLPPSLKVTLPLESRPQRLWIFSHGAEGTIDGICRSQNTDKKFKIDMGYSWYYTWKETDVTGCGNELTLNFKIANGGNLGEIVFYDQNQKIATPDNICDGTKCTTAKDSRFFDEQKFDQQNFLHGTYFDEVYYARAVAEILTGKYPWENTHPALGKFLMTWWVQLTDLNPFEWRFVNAFFGVLLCLLVCLMLMDLTANFNITLLGSLFVTLDFSRVTLSRIATIDVITCFFMIGSYWILGRIIRDFIIHKLNHISLRNTLALAFFLSFAVSIKWNAVFTVVACFGVLGIFISSRMLLGKDVKILKTFSSLAFIFLLAPVTIYFLSFQPFHVYLTSGYNFQRFLQDQINMYQYHSTLKATHGFSSPFWSWPFIQRPMWFYTDKSLQPDWYYTISVIGNPLLWWAIFPAIAYLCLRKYFSKNNPQNIAALVFLLAFCAQFFCWMIASRITFIYHFLPSAIFGSILVAIALNELIKKFRMMVLFYLSATCLTALIFWPIVTGLKIPQWYANYLKFFSSWYF